MILEPQGYKGNWKIVMQSVVLDNKSFDSLIDEKNFVSNSSFLHLSRSDEATDDMAKVKRMHELMRNSIVFWEH